MSNAFIDRKLRSELIRLSQHYAVLVLTGPRQSGKTTLCKTLFSDYHYVNLEDISLREQIAASPKDFLKQYAKGVILDEVQRTRNYFYYIPVVADEVRGSQLVLTASSNFTMREKVTQSLPGRIK